VQGLIGGRHAQLIVYGLLMISTKPTTGVIITISENKNSSIWKKWRGSLGDRDPGNWVLLWFFWCFYFYFFMTWLIALFFFLKEIQAVNRLLSNSNELKRIQIYNHVLGLLWWEQLVVLSIVD
jgi:hypothetical protein